MFSRLLVAIILLVFPLSAHAQQCDGALDAGLLAHYKLDETSGATLQDSAGNYDVTWTDGADNDVSGETRAGVAGGAIYFGSAALRARSSTPVEPEQTTLSAWVKLDQVPSGGNDHYIISLGSDWFTEGCFLRAKRFSPFNFQFSCGYDEGLTVDADDPNGTPEAGRWYHVAGTYDASGTAKLYIDGLLVDQNSGGDSDLWYQGGALMNLMLGDDRLDAHDPLSTIDDVRVYNRALSAKEIQRLYRLNAGDIRYNGSSAAVEYCDGENWVMAGTGSYSPTAVNFEIGDYLAKGSLLDGVVSDNKFSGSFWVQTEVAKQQNILENGVGIYILNTSIRINGNGNIDLRHDFGAPSGTFNDGEWRHVLFSYDLSDTAKRHVYVNNLPIVSSYSAYNNNDINFVNPRISHSSSNAIVGGLADLWIDFGTYIDFSSAAQRAKFISPTGAPMYLGPDGSLPTGSTPDIFLSGDVESWHINKGTGGGFTENGELTYSSTDPGHPYADMTEDGLVGWWKLDETSGNTVIDYANSNNGTYRNSDGPANVKAQGGVHGGALDFTGHRVALGAPDDLDFSGTNAFTISAWVKPGDASGEYVFQRGAGTTSNGSYSFWRYPFDQIRWQAVIQSDSAFLGTLSASGTVNVGEWALMTVTWDGTNLTIYENGVQLHTNSDGGFTGLADNSTPAYQQTSIGSAGRSDSNYFNAPIDDVRVYNRALSQSEIQAIYDSTQCSNPTDRIGSIIYNTDELVMQYCNGKDWVAMGPVGGTGGSGCANPAGAAGDIMFNHDYNVLQFCNSQDWVGIGKQTPPTDGMIAHWTLDEETSPFADTANANTASEVGSVAPLDTRNRGGQLCGDSYGYISAPAVQDYRDLRAFTFSAWVRPDFVDHHHGIIEIIDLAALRFPFQEEYIGFIANAWDGGIGAWNATNYLLDLGDWTHVAVTYDYNAPVGTEPNIYINGILQTSLFEAFTPSGSVASPTDGTALICARDVSGIRRLEGGIDDVRIYERILSHSEITRLYLATL